MIMLDHFALFEKQQNKTKIPRTFREVAGPGVEKETYCEPPFCSEKHEHYQSLRVMQQTSAVVTLPNPR